MMEFTGPLSVWLIHHGPLALFGAITLGVFAIPVPVEPLLLMAGFLTFKGKLSLLPVLFSSIGGAVCGITLSYVLGRTMGHFLVERYGEKIGLSRKNLARVHSWFERMGRWTLFLGFYVPGMRHMTGFVAGMVRLQLIHFMRFGYGGGVVWSVAFLALGYFFGPALYWLM